MMRQVTQTELAARWLESRLAAGPVLSATIRDEGMAVGGWSATVLRRAMATLGGSSTNVAGLFGRRTEWSLPDTEK